MKISKNIFSLSTVLLVLCLVGFSACDNCEDITNPECKNYDPCWEGEVKASFTIMEQFSANFTPVRYFVPYDTDTIMQHSVEFAAPEGFEKYTWLIGSEAIDGRVVYRSNFPRGQTTPITLIVEKRPNTICFPEDDGIDTLTRYMYRTIDRCEQQFDGWYIGSYNRTPNVIDTFKIETCGPYSFDNPYLSDRMSGYFGCEYDVSDTQAQVIDFIIRYKEISFWQGQSNCGTPGGTARISDDDPNEITITYSLEDAREELYVFKGRRIR
ncbi:MAG: hypothetical protein ACPG19_00890 [Saprospiraceae bacterium]